MRYQQAISEFHKPSLSRSNAKCKSFFVIISLICMGVKKSQIFITIISLRDRLATQRWPINIIH